MLQGPEDAAKNTGVRWNFRDNTWQARCRRADGTWATNTKGVRRRITCEKDPLFKYDFETAKKLVYEELETWMASEREAASPQEDQQQ